MIQEWDLLTALTIEQTVLIVCGLDEYKTFGQVTFEIKLKEKRGHNTKELYDSYNKALEISKAMSQDRKTLESYGIDPTSKRELYKKASLYQWLVDRNIESVGVESLNPKSEMPSEVGQSAAKLSARAKDKKAIQDIGKKLHQANPEATVTDIKYDPSLDEYRKFYESNHQDFIGKCLKDIGIKPGRRGVKAKTLSGNSPKIN